MEILKYQYFKYAISNFQYETFDMKYQIFNMQMQNPKYLNYIINPEKYQKLSSPKYLNIE